MHAYLINIVLQFYCINTNSLPVSICKNIYYVTYYSVPVFHSYLYWFSLLLSLLYLYWFMFILLARGHFAEMHYLVSVCSFTNQ